MNETPARGLCARGEGKTMTKSEVARAVSDECGIAPADVKDVLNALGEVLRSLVRSSGDGERIPVIPGIVVYKRRRGATRARQMISPLTGKPMVIKAKPAHWVIKASVRAPLKGSV